MAQRMKAWWQKQSAELTAIASGVSSFRRKPGEQPSPGWRKVAGGSARFFRKTAGLRTEPSSDWHTEDRRRAWRAYWFGPNAIAKGGFAQTLARLRYWLHFRGFPFRLVPATAASRPGRRRAVEIFAGVGPRPRVARENLGEIGRTGSLPFLRGSVINI